MLRFVVGALIYLGFAFVSPFALVAAPLGLLLLLQRPAGRESVIGAAALVLAGWIAFGGGDAFGRFEGAWVCLLAGGTVVALAWRPAPKGLVGTGLIAVSVAGVAGSVAIALTSFSWGELYWLAQRHYGFQARLLLEGLTMRLGALEGGADVLATLETGLNQTVDLVSRLLPALILLQSVAALAAAWALYQKVARHPEGEPLPRLRDFRFSDHLIWGVVLALVALVFPGAQALRLVGGNLAAFFGALYVVRGLGIVAALAAAAGVGGPFAALLAFFAMVFLLPLVMFAALALGVTDTWMDWRKAAKKKA